QAISQIVHRYDAHLVIDGAQLAAHRQISVSDLGIDYFAFSGHKTYAPFGSGVLIARKGLMGFEASELAKINSSGEKNVVGISAMGKALLLLQRIGLDTIEDYEQSLTQQLLHGLTKIPGIKLYGIRDPEAPRFQDRLGIIVLSSNTVPHNILAKELAEYGGIGVRNGCFCAHMFVSRLMKIHPIRVATSKVLFNFVPNLTSSLLPGLVRVSIGLENNELDATHFLRILTHITQKPRSFINKLLAASHNGSPFEPHTDIEDQMRTFTLALVKQVFSPTSGLCPTKS
ncbi:MAG: aminotransferase class V-fold PLP-dependent enzyme, partial [Candidatus Hermodarchaeia archaeon]